MSAFHVARCLGYLVLGCVLVGAGGSALGQTDEQDPGCCIHFVNEASDRWLVLSNKDGRRYTVIWPHSQGHVRLVAGPAFEPWMLSIYNTTDHPPANITHDSRTLYEVFASSYDSELREAVTHDDPSCLWRDHRPKPVSYTHLTLPTNREV